MMKFRLAYISLLAGIFLSSCSDVLRTEEIDPEKDDRIAFNASNARMITKSGLEYESFDVGTKYHLYGVETGKDWAVGNTVMYRTPAEETDKQLIDYGDDLHFRDKTYDFYGTTICSTGDEYPADNTAAGNSPVICLSLKENALDDLMYSNNLKGCTRASGLLQMNFIHALSKIQVEVSKQNESAELAGAKIHSITLKDTHSSGQLDIVNGSWALEGTTDRVFTQTPVTLSTAPVMVKDASGTADAEMLIFPNEDTRKLSLEVTYSINGGEVKTVVCEILEHDGTPFLFRQNYRYTLAVTIANDGIQIVTVLPKVYEWINIDVPSYLGQPVTFGNLMWMDRNLGAISADYKNDWYNTIGHYFQFGRNIPYILDIEKFKAYTGDGYFAFNFAGKTVYVMKYRNKGTGVENVYYYDSDGTYYTRAINLIASEGYDHWPASEKWEKMSDWSTVTDEKRTVLIRNAVECIYTYDHLGEKVYGVKYVAPTNESSVGDDVKNTGAELVRNPDRIGADEYKGLSDAQLSELYKFGFGTKKPGTLTNLQRPTVWTFNNSCGAEYWLPGDSHADPCPKGWRLPTKEDLNVLMPTVQINWATSGAYPQTKTTSTEDIRYGTTGGHHVCYILKNIGTNNAYRLRIMSHYTEDGLNNKRYFSISRYGATAEDLSLDKYLSGDHSASSKEKTMWANPIETICYPACGFIVPDGDGKPESVHPDLRSFGTGTVIRTADSNPDAMAGADGSSAQGFSYVQYLSTTDYELSIQQNSRRSLGDQIRCVRDINAVD
ncbi:MAG: fimbrillin family protein [Bacteroidales bacterium]|nr:fimbrillin family protein [Bacteroidales bacterium]